MLREIRVHLCQRSPASEGLREFIRTSYTKLKNKVKIPILIREVEGVEARVFFVDQVGQEKITNVENLSKKEISDIFNKSI